MWEVKDAGSKVGAARVTLIEARTARFACTEPEITRNGLPGAWKFGLDRLDWLTREGSLWDRSKQFSDHMLPRALVLEFLVSRGVRPMPLAQSSP